MNNKVEVVRTDMKHIDAFVSKKSLEKIYTTWSLSNYAPSGLNCIEALYFICRGLNGSKNRDNENTLINHFPSELPVSRETLEWVFSFLPYQMSVKYNFHFENFKHLGEELFIPFITAEIMLSGKEENRLLITTRIESAEVTIAKLGHVQPYLTYIWDVMSSSHKTMYTVLNILQKCSWTIVD